MSPSSLMYNTFWLGFLFILTATPQQLCYDSQHNWQNTIAVSKTITSLQVVGNPLLNPDTSPVASKLFQLLSEIPTNLIRYVPWFPYPKVGVAELEPPSGGSTSWDFSYIEPQFRRFMNSTYSQGRTVILNFSTQPTWMYNTSQWDYPVDVNKVDWGYPRGNAMANTTDLLVGYYSRLISWIVEGSMVDEYGVKHYNTGPTYQFTHWEVFNEPEGCHGLDVKDYTKQYDAIVAGVRKMVDPQRRIKWVGLALSGRELDWISYFLDPLNHDPAVLPLDWISYHFYASCSNRTDPNSYEQFFTAADGFFPVAQQIMDIKNHINPSTKIDIDELGIILPGDTTNNIPQFPLIYWNAAAAFYAYVFGNLAPMGYDALGESQFVGVPNIPEWDILDAQFSGVSMTNWTTGEGNARYWVLRLLLDTFQPGDVFVHTTAYQQVFCAELDMTSGTASLACADPQATINAIQFAAYGQPNGSCQNYQRNPDCDAKNVTAYVTAKCVGQNSCTILSYPTFGNPCNGAKRLVIQATCTGSNGGSGHPSNYIGLYTQGAIDVKSSLQKILILNKKNAVSCVTITGITGGKAYILDESSGFGPARIVQIQSDSITLQPFGVAVVFLKNKK